MWFDSQFNSVYALRYLSELAEPFRFYNKVYCMVVVLHFIKLVCDDLVTLMMRLSAFYFLSICLLDVRNIIRSAKS